MKKTPDIWFAFVFPVLFLSGTGVGLSVMVLMVWGAAQLIGM